MHWEPLGPVWPKSMYNLLCKNGKGDSCFIIIIFWLLEIHLSSYQIGLLKRIILYCKVVILVVIVQHILYSMNGNNEGFQC